MTPFLSPSERSFFSSRDAFIFLKELYVYPVKSLAGIAVAGATLDAAGGLNGDREWVIVNAGGEVTWQGAIPRLALVQPAVSAETLTLRMPGQEPLTVVRQGPRAGCVVRIWNEQARQAETFPGEDAGDEAAAWLTGALGQTLRLVRLGAEARQRSDRQPLHILSASSVQVLRGELRRRAASPVEMQRFRPNLVIEAREPEPFLEEGVAALVWDTGACIQMEGPCVRCVMPNIDLHDARVGREPLATLVRMSAGRHPGAPVRFGMYGRAVAGTRLGRGQAGWAVRSEEGGTRGPGAGAQN